MLLRDYLEKHIFTMPDKDPVSNAEIGREKKYCKKFSKGRWLCKFYTKEDMDGCKTHCHLKQLKKYKSKKDYPLLYRNK